MSNILDFHHRTLARGRHMLELGRPQDARGVLEHLISMPDLEPRLRLETLRTLNQIEFQAGRHRRARGYLRQAIELAPTDPELYELFALNIEADGSAKLATALKAIRRAIQIDPLEARFWALRGRLALAVGKRRLARKSFRRLARLAPTSLSVLETAVTGFMQLRLPEEAVKLLMIARSEHENPASLGRLWKLLKFEVVRMNQELDADDAVVLLVPTPIAATTATRVPGEGIVRVDRGSAGPVPHVIRRINLSR